MTRLCFALLFAIAISWTPQSRAATELEEREAITAAALSAFFHEDFSQLEEMSRVYRQEKTRTSSGLWKLTLFYAGIGEAIDTSAQGRNPDVAFQDAEAKTRRWAQKFPASPSARIAHSMMLLSRAWAYRGTGYARTVKPEAWAPFRKYVEMAREDLESYKAIAGADPRWYEEMLTVAKAQSWDRREFDRLLDEALDREPLFYQTYFAALEYLLPKWHGGTQEIEDFARDATKRTSKQEGKGMYARIYWYASQAQYQNDLFAGSQAAWSRMKAGFEDVVARYPDAWNLNNYAKFACLAQDKQKTRELLKRIDSDIVPEAWQPEPLRGQCVEWSSR